MFAPICCCLYNNLKIGYIMCFMMVDQLLTYLQKHYRPEDYPVIRAQYADFESRKPFAGLKILEATPLFFNTIAKFLPLIAGGAQVTLSHIKGVPFDPAFIDWAEQVGLRVVRDKSDEFDLISDCIGLHSDLHPRYGFAELTHSGISYYENSAKPCFNTDGSRIKRIEGALGTGDGLIRGLQLFGHQVDASQRWLLFGFGKIGSGVGIRLKATGAQVEVVEARSLCDRLQQTPVGKFPFIDMTDRDAVIAAVQRATHIVTATSVAGVISRSYPVEPFLQGQLLVNIGAEDEYGDKFPETAVLNRKVAVNFALDEPTHLRYIETTFALQNAGLEWILHHPEARGVIIPSEEMQEQLLSIVRREGAIADELRLIGL